MSGARSPSGLPCQRQWSMLLYPSVHCCLKTDFCHQFTLFYEGLKFSFLAGDGDYSVLDVLCCHVELPRGKHSSAVANRGDRRSSVHSSGGSRHVGVDGAQV